MGYEESKINFPCPECTQSFQMSLRHLSPDEVVVCPICGAASPDGDLSEINQAFEKVEIELMDIQKILYSENYNSQS